MSHFCHLHCHTQYSLLDGAAPIKPLIARTKELGMHAIAITDHGNMFGVPHFVAEAKRQGIKPIIGCEFYLARESRHDRKDKTRYHQLLLAKDEVGYQNLIKLSSLSYTEGFYYKPRIDRELVAHHAEGLIATTCCLGAQIPQTILKEGEAAAEQHFLAWREIFGDDYYIELQRFGLAEQEQCNEILLRWSKKHETKVIATNDVHYIHQKDAIAQDVLLCLQTGKKYNDQDRMRFVGDQFFLKSPKQMAETFHDIPEALTNTLEVAEKVQEYTLERKILLPNYALPARFDSQDVYLAHLAREGLSHRYDEVTPEIEARLQHELSVITDMGFAGYFLIARDLIVTAREMGVMVGPGRGTVSGSIVAYLIDITGIDPIKYQLIFERFLNPERITMPDIDIDLDDEGRKKVINYLISKYGKEQVAHIITFGSMAPRSAIKDVARVLEMPLPEANALAALIPERPGTTFAQARKEEPKLQAAFASNAESMEKRVLTIASTLEGVSRHTGIHAAGIIIAPDKLTNYLPVKTDKETDLLVTQYDGNVVESVGMLKMDLLGLRTLSIIRDAVASIESNHGKKIDIDTIPLDDDKTFALFQQGSTVGVFQFESKGMQKWLMQLKPTNIEDLIAMNALYRPGPMQFIPNFIARKHGKQPIHYPHPLLEELLGPTYGIMVYQEQIMKTAQVIAGYSLGQADLLRRAMGKKKADVMAQQRNVFIAGAAEKHKLPKAKALALFDVMEGFAMYGFNRSHAVAYAIIAYQTAYLKANYPTEYMAAILKHNQGDLDKVTFFIEACKQMGIQVLPPDINASGISFSPTKEGHIRFGLAAIKGVGEGVVEEITQVRKADGDFKDIYDFTERVISRKVTKRLVEPLVMAGAFDAYNDYHRRQYVYAPEGKLSLVEQILQYAQRIKKDKESLQQSLFAAEPSVQYNARPKPMECTPLTPLETLEIEKELVGFYISGHPLDGFKSTVKSFCSHTTQSVLSAPKENASLAGVVTASAQRINKAGKAYTTFTIEDYKGALPLALFGSAHQKYGELTQKGAFLYLKGNTYKRYGQRDELDFRVINILPLAEVKAKLAKTLTVTVPIATLSQQVIAGLSKALKASPGSTPLMLHLVAAPERMAVTVYAKSHQVALSTTFLARLDALQLSYTFGK